MRSRRLKTHAKCHKLRHSLRPFRHFNPLTSRARRFGARPQCYCLCRRRMTRITDSCVRDGDDRADRTRAGSCCPSKQRGWVRFVFVRYCWAALTARKFYGRRQNTIECLKFEWSARVSIVFASGRARADEVAFVVISNLRDVPGEQSLNKNQVVGGV